MFLNWNNLLTHLPFGTYVLNLKQSFTVLPAKSDSDIMFCL